MPKHSQFIWPPNGKTWAQCQHEFHADFARHIAEDPDSQKKLANYQADREPFVNCIREFATKWPGLYVDKEDAQLVQVVGHELGRIAKSGKSPAAAAALACFKIERFCERNAHRNFLEENGITKAYRDDPGHLFTTEGVPEIFLERRKTSYPPLGKWICKSQDILNLWSYHLQFDPKADNRLPRHKPVLIKENKLSKIVDASTSCIIKDKANPDDIVMIVLRGCFTIDVGEWLDEIIEEATSTRRNIRRDDEGDLVMVGLSAGARSKPAFHWVRNLLRKFSQEQVNDFDLKQCSAFAFLWNWLRCNLHPKILANFDEWMEESMIPPMTPEWQKLAANRKGSYTVALPGWKTFTFNNVELAPPAGVMASNYARPMHYETQPHDYAVAFTARRTGELNDGGHFYVGSYGIKVESAANTLVVWKPKHVHGTSLQNRHPYDTDPNFIQRGLAIVTSPRLTNMWKKYASQLSLDLTAVNKEAKKVEAEVYEANKEVDEIYATPQ